MPQSRPEWIAIGYSAPATPSRGRVYIWRRLRALGAQTFRPGMAILPNTRENLTQLELLAEKIHAFSGEAFLAELNFLSPGDNERMRTRFSQACEQEYHQMLNDCSALLDRLACAPDEPARADLEKQLSKTVGRYRKSPARTLGGQAAGELERGLSELFGALRSIPTELAAMLRGDPHGKDDRG